jgi:ubiquitin-protein ligase
MASPIAHKRLMKEYAQMQSEPDPSFRMIPNSANILEWFFIFKGAPKSPYEKGFYLGKLVFGKGYPFSGAPDIYMFTPNGRMHTNARICLSVCSSFHPESWNPAYGPRQVMLSLQSFMMDDHDPSTHGSIYASEERRRQLAQESAAWNRRNATYQSYFQGFIPETKSETEEKEEKEKQKEMEPKPKAKRKANATKARSAKQRKTK